MAESIVDGLDDIVTNLQQLLDKLNKKEDSKATTDLKETQDEVDELFSNQVGRLIGFTYVVLNSILPFSSTSLLDSNYTSPISYSPSLTVKCMPSCIILVCLRFNI